MKPTLFTHRKAIRLIAGWCGLLLYVGVFSPVGVGLAELVGKFDPNHQALVQVGARGAKLVLHHEQPCPTHRHGLIARTLTLFAAPTRPGLPDHVLQFGAAEIISGKELRSATPPIQLDQPCFATRELRAASQCENFLSGMPTHPPSPQRGQLLGLRSTLLLI